ncbi:acetyl-CoA C-acyltransferase [Elioraea sp.]|uniref:acetyl-CoA C-acyltransferase n=1 Tax=Elioraea sp. TaxID=2185103 RepID=UPI0025C661D1|nr:acetyl-CoA C-acyltransferase [Elioraea sp.]
MSSPIVILGAARTPIGGLLGELSPLAAPKLGGHAIAAALSRARVQADQVTGVTMGNVLSAGIGQAPARQAAFAAGLGEAVPCTTLNKMCGSGMQAVMNAAQALAAGDDGILVAGGMESMSNAPYLLPKARGGMKFGHGQVLDHMALDGLEDAYAPGRLMGTFAEDTAASLGISRADQDAFATRSLERALAAGGNGALADEIAPISVPGRKGDILVSLDEQPRRADPAKIPTLRAAFRDGGTVTAANSSSISDGAAALVLAREEDAEARGLRPLARIIAMATHAQAPAWFTTAPVEAIRKVLDRAGWTIDDVDLFEINEAFAVVVLAAERALGLPPEKVNIRGGACAVGHPIGASGARILVTLLAALRREGLKRGVAAVCIGGGEATAVAVELL